MHLADHSRKIPLPREAFDTMLRFARLMHRLESTSAYAEALHASLPTAARYNPGLPSVLMGYDFHLTPEGPKLIEINNNAGGLYVGDGIWLPQPPIPELTDGIKVSLNGMFPSGWRKIAIMDEHVQQQYMYTEMLAYAEVMGQYGRTVHVVNPEQLVERNDGLYIGTDRIDAIYNRHTDFYLETPEVAHIRRAYLSGRVALTPHPRSYALLGDKGRMVDWWHEGLLEQVLSSEEIAFVRTVVPEIHRLDEMDRETVWAERKQWVFKPAARHGGKGVLLGSSLGRRRFSEMSPSEIVVQRYVPPGKMRFDDHDFKVDLRLYMHAEDLIGVAGRIWRGQVTNFRAPGSGFVPLDIGT